MNERIDLRELTAPCGLDCFNCPLYLSNDNEELRKQMALLAHGFGVPYDEAYEKVACKGCRARNGIPPLATEQCKVSKCVSSKGIETCAGCSDFPCDNLQPFADKAAHFPHNMKVYNLALIRKMGMDKWAQEKARRVRDRYFGETFNI